MPCALTLRTCPRDGPEAPCAGGSRARVRQRPDDAGVGAEARRPRRRAVADRRPATAPASGHRLTDRGHLATESAGCVRPRRPSGWAGVAVFEETDRTRAARGPEPSVRADREAPMAARVRARPGRGRPSRAVLRAVRRVAAARRRRRRPTRPTRPVPSSSAAGGSGTGARPTTAPSMPKPSLVRVVHQLDGQLAHRLGEQDPHEVDVAVRELAAGAGDVASRACRRP